MLSFIKIISLSIFFIFIFHFIWTKIQKNIPKKDLIRSQTEKYKKMLEEISQSGAIEDIKQFLSPEQKILMEHELYKIIETEFQ